MNKLKDDRIKMLEEAISKIEILTNLYIEAYPSWILLNQSKNFIKSVHFLESESSFDDASLGILSKPNKGNKK